MCVYLCVCVSVCLNFNVFLFLFFIYILFSTLNRTLLQCVSVCVLGGWIWMQKVSMQQRTSVLLHPISVQSLSVSNSVTPWTEALQVSLSITNSNSCPYSWWCHPTISSSVIPFSSCLQSFSASWSFPMSQFFTSGGQSFSFSISPSNEYSGLIPFRMDWLDLLAVQGTLKSLLQHHSSKASILQCSAFFTVRLSHPYMTTGKAIALTRWTSVGKVMSLIFNMLSRLVIAFLPRRSVF